MVERAGPRVVHPLTYANPSWYSRSHEASKTFIQEVMPWSNPIPTKRANQVSTPRGPGQSPDPPDEEARPPHFPETPMIVTETQMRRPSEAEELDAPSCRSCGSQGEDVLVVEFPGIPCDCDTLPSPHPYEEALCGNCRRMLTVARGRAYYRKSRN